MFKKTVTYKNFNDVEETDTFYFNLSQVELLELETEIEGGFSQFLETIIETQNPREMIQTFKRLITMSVGEKSADGKHFIKNDEVRERFTQHAAFPMLYMEFASNATSAAAFIRGIMPAELQGQIDEAEKAIAAKEAEKAEETKTSTETVAAQPFQS